MLRGSPLSIRRWRSRRKPAARSESRSRHMTRRSSNGACGEKRTKQMPPSPSCGTRAVVWPTNPSGEDPAWSPYPPSSAPRGPLSPFSDNVHSGISASAGLLRQARDGDDDAGAHDALDVPRNIKPIVEGCHGEQAQDGEQDRRDASYEGDLE